MKRTLTFTSAVVVTALSLAALPAAAQNRGSSGQARGGGHATAGSSAPARQSAPRASAGRSYSAPQSMSRSYGNRSYASPQAMGRSYGSRSYAAPQAMSRSYGNRSYAAPRSVPRAYGGSSYRAPSSGYNNRYGYNNRSGYGARSYGGYGMRSNLVRPYFSRSYARPFGWMPYSPFRFLRPYYLFSPWLDLGFGLWAGFPVPYPWAYLGDYQPSVFGDYPDGSYQVTPGATNYGGNQVTPGPTNYGGVSFDIQPPDADLFVDGEYVGTVANFGPNSEPLTLAPGPHRIAIQHQGFRPMEWDVTVEPGQVIPYRGVLERQ